MKHIWTSVNRNKNTLLFLNIIFVIGIICGFIYFNYLESEIFINLEKAITNINFNSNLFYHIIFISVIFLFSILFLGPLIGLFLYFYEAISIGFIIHVFYYYSGISGVIYSVLYVFLFKFIYIVFFAFILLKSMKIFKNVIAFFILKKYDEIKKIIISNYISILKYSVIIFVYDIFIQFCGNSILKIFSFLI